jgi:DNA-binding transcriptional LysR family regulator
MLVNKAVYSMEFLHLTTFTTVARMGSFTTAARSLRLSQSSISQHIKVLEAELGTPLFIRTTRQVRLTDAGKRFLGHAHRLLSQAAQVQQEMTQLAEGVQGHSTVGTLPSLAVHLLAPAISRLQRCFPEVQVEIKEGSQLELEAYLQSGEVDFGVLELPAHTQPIHSHLLFREPYNLLVPRGHRLATRRQVRLQELAHEKFIVFPDSARSRADLRQAFHQMGLNLQIAVEVASALTLASMVQAGAGVALAPALVFQHVQLHDIAILDLIAPRFSRMVGLIWHRDQYLSPVTRNLMQLLCKQTGNPSGDSASLLPASSRYPSSEGTGGA